MIKFTKRLNDLITAARILNNSQKQNTPISEYERGMAELIIDVSKNLNQDKHKDLIIRLIRMDYKKQFN